MSDKIQFFSDDLDFEYPSYSNKGWLLFEIIGPSATGVYTYEIDRYEIDTQNSSFWIQEGMGVEYFIEEYAPKNLKAGWYVFDGIHGNIIKGDYYTIEDDEEWYFDNFREATEEEISSGCVDNNV